MLESYRSFRILVAAMVAFALAGQSASGQSLADRGDYLVNVIGACGNCHTPREKGQPDLSRELSGGFQTFDEPWFRVKGSNLTPDPETGLGKWSDEQIKRALLDGVRPNGTHLAPVMPYALYRVMSAGDVDAIVAYLRRLKPIRSEVPTPVYKKEAPPEAYPDAARPMSQAELASPVKRGAYLAAVDHCMHCHSRRSTDVMPDYVAAWGAGGRVFKSPAGEAKASNISSHKTSGLGAWSDAEIKRALTEGVSRDGRKLKPPMVGYAAYWRKLKAEDLDALVAWMRSIPPVE